MKNFEGLEIKFLLAVLFVRKFFSCFCLFSGKLEESLGRSLCWKRLGIRNSLTHAHKPVGVDFETESCWVPSIIRTRGCAAEDRLLARSRLSFVASRKVINLCH